MTASAAGLLAVPGSAPYAVTKAGAVAFAQHVYAMHASRGVRVHCICPQGVDTAMLHNQSPPGKNPSTLAVQDGIVSATDVATAFLQAVIEDRFYVFPHPVVQKYMAMRGAQPEKWLRAVSKAVARSKL